MSDQASAGPLPVPVEVRSSKKFFTSEKTTSILYPIITFVLLLVVWESSVTYFNVPDYMFPRIMPVMRELYTGYVDGLMYPHLLYTLKSTLAGYVIGCTLAIIVGALLAESRTFEKFVYPFVIALQSTPKVAIAPLIMIWCGYGLASKIVMVATMCFFPLFVNTISGIRQTDPAMLNMMRAFSSPGWLTFFRVKMFAAAGHIFAGLQISIVFALIGAVVGEFVASSAGLGWLVQSAMANFNTPLMFASIFSLVALGLAGTSLVRFVHRRVVFWDRSVKAASH
jgi:NitT/TauT family transport system permease protein